MKEFLRGIVQALEKGEPVELVSILKSSGSTPRRAGAMMAVFPGGRSSGTIGGGNVEYEAQNFARTLLDKHSDAVRHFRFLPGDAANLGMVCGGDVTLLFHYFPAGSYRGIAVFQDLIKIASRNVNVWFLQRVQYERVTDFGIAGSFGVRHLSKAPGNLKELLSEKTSFNGTWFTVPIARAGRTFLFGGGHVSQALVPVLASVGFRPTVFDDRPEFADPARFPMAEEVLCGDFLSLGEEITISPDDYVVVMTRGHQADFEVLTQVLRSGAKYIGCIGSKRKLAICRNQLLAQGFTAAEYDRIHAPIGLPIGSETPEEIAISIAAEMIAVRAGALPLDPGSFFLERKKEPKKELEQQCAKRIAD